MNHVNVNVNLIEKIVIQINGRVMINVTEIIESKILTKHESCECKCKFNRINCNSDQWQNIDKCQCECKKQHVC